MMIKMMMVLMVMMLLFLLMMTLVRYDHEESMQGVGAS